MSKCKKCGEEVVWKKSPAGKFLPPQNPNGTAHHCEGTPAKQPVSQPVPASQPSATPEKQMKTVAGTYIAKTSTIIKIKDSTTGEEDQYLADLELLKMLNRPEPPANIGDAVTVQLVEHGEHWLIRAIKKAEVKEEGFRSAKDILQENLDAKKAEEQKNLAAQVAEVEKRNAEDKAYAEKLAAEYKAKAEQKKAIDTVPTRKEAEMIVHEVAEETASRKKTIGVETGMLSQRELAVMSRSASSGTHTFGAVSLKVHISMGSYCNFDLGVEGSTGEHARTLMEEEATETVDLMIRVMKKAMIASQQVKY